MSSPDPLLPWPPYFLALLFAPRMTLLLAEVEGRGDLHASGKLVAALLALFRQLAHLVALGLSEECRHI